MANNFEIRTTEKITEDFINKNIEEYVDKWLFGLFKIDYEDSNGVKNFKNWGRYSWIIKVKSKEGFMLEFTFWIN